MRSKLLILFLCVCVACTNSRLNKENITITVDVEKIPEYGFVISNQDGHMQTLEFDTNRHAEYIIENLEAAYLTLHNGFSENINFYAEKGDQIHLTYDGISMEKTLKTNGVRQPIIDYLKKIKISWIDLQNYTLGITEFSKLLEKEIKKNLVLLDSNKTTLSKASKKFITLEQNRIKYLMGISLLNYPEKHQKAFPNSVLQINKEYYNTLKEWMQEDATLLCLNEYQYFMLKSSSILAELGIQTNTPYEKLLAQMKYIQSHLKNEQVKQSLLTILAHDYIEQNGIEKIEELDQFYRQHITDPQLKSQYETVFNSWATIAPGQKAIDFNAADSTGKMFSLQDFKGKYVYIYLWLNVYPCIKEYKTLKELQPLLDEKKITLVSLSLENDQEQWKNALSNQEIQTGLHLYLGQNKDFLRAYHYDSYGIDQFIMIDPHGNIIQTHAPKPSSEEFKNLLQSLSKI